MGVPAVADGRSSDAPLGPRAQRTVDLILDTTRAEFLAHGYGGTRIDDIARTTGISRASFYTYFRSKRDVLIALADGVVRSEARVVRMLSELQAGCAPSDVERWVRAYFRHLDEHGGVVLVWDQATHDEDDLLELGNRAKSRSWQRVGTRSRSCGASSWATRPSRGCCSSACSRPRGCAGASARRPSTRTSS